MRPKTAELDTNVADKFPPQLIKFLNELNKTGEFYLVGGCIRDALLGRTPKDFDIMVVKPSPEELEKLLPVQKVGAAFPVYLYDTKDPVLGVIEFAYARKEIKQGEGYKGFSVEVVDDVRQDLARRDLTVNNIAWSPEKGLVTFGPESLEDVQNQTLRHVTDAFAEDPVRVLRACRFSAQLPGEWVITPETLTMMSSLKGELAKEPPDRIREELNKALKAVKPGNFFRNLNKAECLQAIFPELVPEVESIAAILDANAKHLDVILMYCLMAPYMESDSAVESFGKRLTLGFTREMLVWRKADVNPLRAPQDYLNLYKSVRQGKLTQDLLFQLLDATGRSGLNVQLDRVFSALKGLDYSKVQPKEIPTLMLDIIRELI